MKICPPTHYSLKITYISYMEVHIEYDVWKYFERANIP